ncbi:MAG TPA: hypothetical protein VGM12_31905 [Trebonia sp.]|jgi:hypothetical protein
MAEWWAIEVFSSDKLPASGWRYAYEDELTEAAITHGAVYYEWHDTQYGVVFETLFPSDTEWDAFRALPAVRAALDGVPDPVNGLLIYRGRGGAAGGGKPRRPKPAPGAAELELEEPKRRPRVPRKLRYNDDGDELKRLMRELEGQPAPLPEPGPEPGPGAEPQPPAEPVRVEPDPNDPVWRGMAAFDRYGD